MLNVLECTHTDKDARYASASKAYKVTGGISKLGESMENIMSTYLLNTRESLTSGLHTRVL